MTKLEQAALSLLAHLDTPAWKQQKPTADLMGDLRAALAEQGCDYCNSPLFAGTSCPNCGRVVEPDHFADAGNKVPDHIAASGKVILTEHTLPTISMRQIMNSENNYSVEVVICGLNSSIQADLAMSHIEKMLCGIEIKAQ